MNQPPEAPQADDLIGSTVGSFQIVKLLGRGGMGMVYLGENSVIGSKVAVKFLHGQLATNPDLVGRFYAEARAVNLIGHENIVNIFDMNVAAGNRPYFIMEYLDGKALTELARGPLAEEVAIPILVQVCEALQAAHAHGVVHRDLKPENIVLIRRGRNQHFVKVLDFGIAKLYGEGARTSETSAGVIVGTPEYMAPEQASAEKVDGRADLYSIGVIAYLLATGRLPFEGGGVTGLLIAHREKIPIAPHLVNARVPLVWSELIMRALAKRPEDRFHDAAEMQAALEKVLATPHPVLPTPAPSVSRFGISSAAGLPSSTPAPDSSAGAKPSFEVSLIAPDGSVKSRLRCTDLSRGGLYLCAEPPFPAVGARLNVFLELPFGRVGAAVEVVRQVEPAQALSWNMPAGFFVKFDQITPPVQDAISRYAKGELQAEVPRPVASDDPSAEPFLARYRQRTTGDWYALLELPVDAEMSEVVARGREVRRELDRLAEKNLSPSQRTQADAARTKFGRALEAIGTVKARAAYDAEHANYKGVARCFAAGLTATDADELRKKHLASHPGQQARSLIQLATGGAYEGAGSVAQALTAYEEALRADPLSLDLHKRYWALLKKTPSGHG